MGLEVSGFGFRVSDFGFRFSEEEVASQNFEGKRAIGRCIEGIGGEGGGFRVSGFAFRVSGFEVRDSGFGFRGPGFGFRGPGFEFRGPRFWFRVSGSRIREPGFGFRGAGFGFRVSGCGVRDSGIGGTYRQAAGRSPSPSSSPCTRTYRVTSLIRNSPPPLPEVVGRQTKRVALGESCFRPWLVANRGTLKP